MRVLCYVESCKNHNNDEGYCMLETISISEDKLTAAGYLPMCDDYKERDDDEQ